MPGDGQHLLWNRLIRREHPLKGAPLVGAQLRYLIWAGAEVIGAIGFGPPSFYLACRDGWIGWDAQAREQNRHRVIGLSRFLHSAGITLRQPGQPLLRGWSCHGCASIGWSATA